MRRSIALLCVAIVLLAPLAGVCTTLAPATIVEILPHIAPPLMVRVAIVAPPLLALVSSHRLPRASLPAHC